MLEDLGDIFFFQADERKIRCGVVGVAVFVNKVAGDTVIFDYEPDMTDRPEALDYLMGKRDDFND